MMEFLIQFQGICESPWMKQYLEGKLVRLERYLVSGAHIEVKLISEGDKCRALVFISTPKHEYSFSHEGMDLFEAFTGTLDEALRILRKDHQRLIERVHRKFSESTDLSQP